MIFKKIKDRNEKNLVILGNNNEKYIDISLERLRFIIINLIKEFKNKKIKNGDTVLLASIHGNNELFIALMYGALSAYGVKIFLPFFLESEEIDSWIKKTDCKAIILSENEILSQKKYQKEKEGINKIKSISEKNKLVSYDLIEDFNLKSYLNKPIEKNDIESEKIIKEIINNTDFNTDSTIFTTSGSSGKSKLILYDQGAFICNCICWQESGMYNKDKMGGRSLIIVFSHTMSVRAFYNAIWTGIPMCIISASWIKEKPEKVLPVLMKMKIENITGGPSGFSLIANILKNYPELKDVIFSDFKTVVSSGAKYDLDAVRNIRNIFGLKTHNAYGTTETQQVLTTVLNDNDKEYLDEIPLGKPLIGVEIGLKKFENEYDDYYKLFVKTPFGHKCIIDEEEKSIYGSDGFFDTGDIIRYENNEIYYVGRENRDFINDGYGFKVPFSYLKNIYQKIYNYACHIEYYVPRSDNLVLGLAALIFIDDKKLQRGKVSDKKIISRFYNIIKDINCSLNNFETHNDSQHVIVRFLVINDIVPVTVKGNVSKQKIDNIYCDCIEELINSKKDTDYVENITDFKTRFNLGLSKISPMRVNIFRKFIVGVYLKYNKK